MTSIKRAGRIATFGFALGAGLLIASGAGAAVASAAPDDSSHASTSKSSASSARTHKPVAAAATRASARPKPPSASAVQLPAKRTTAATSPSSLRSVSLVSTDAPTAPTASAKQYRAQRLPTPTEIEQAVVAGLDAARRTLDTMRRDFELLVKHQIEGVRDNLTTLRYDLEAIFGPSRRPVNPDIPPDGTSGIIGNPLDKVGYFIYQDGKNICLLVSSAMVMGQLLGPDKMPTAAEIINEAATTPSTVTAGAKIYDPVADSYVQNADALALLDAHGITAMSTQYSKNQGDLAYANLKKALIDGNSVIVTIKAQIAWGQGTPDMAYSGDHAITVLGIDTDKDVIFVNDGAWKNGGQGMGLPLNTFMKAWRANDYQTITAYVTPAQD
ncbi:C39 family peptidase [Mycolicibacterium aichiense]|uniref:Peptidase C39-like domain-containing protein n=1 Tax=Mycolicibacterium aichiense TaxID=1799 RepID=A0AAD1HH34_9MYCO|nr:C39 family peptidase [Mycolicibacterium aichiense]MCV7020696.1 C39 family peptidase [Mycolicibacterium aichiense]BBX05263.1 hypothetical protein MAIC_00660 [Mycolicibacterium aichiense]STZ25384.1 putative secreted protein [Mycolicibacterium aichiense]